MAELQSGEITVDGVRSSWIGAGPSDAPEAAVFLHGNPGSRLDWEDLVGAIGDFARAIAFDLPGFGGSDPGPDFDYSPEGYARFATSALRELGIERAHFVLHDIGGAVTWAMATEHPQTPLSLTIFNTGFFDGNRWHRAARMWRRPVLGELVQRAVTRRLFERALTSDGRAPLPAAFVDRMYGDYDPTTRRAVLKLYRAMDMPYPASARWKEALRSLDLPVLIVWGSRDPFVKEAAIDRLTAVFADAEVELLPESGHFPFADDPQRTRQAVVPFLRTRLGAGSRA